MQKIYSQRTVSFGRMLFSVLIIFFTGTTKLKSQTPVTSVSTSYFTASTGTTYVDNGAPNSVVTANTYTYKYGNLSGTTNNSLHLNSFVAGAVTYTPVTVAGTVIKMRRVDNALVTGIRNVKFEEGNIDASNNITVTGAYNDDMESFFIASNSFNSGTDNLFANQDDGNGNINNIERVDVLFPSATRATDNSKVGFSIFERGYTGQHDPVKAALVLSVDGTGKPASYSSIISITAANYGDVLPTSNYIIQRRDNAVETHLKYTLVSAQLIGGVFLKYADFGIADNTSVYGYSLFCNDFTGTPAQAVDYTNATYFPTNSDNNNGYGGIDLVAISGVSQSGSVLLPVKLTGFTARQQGTKLALQWTTAEQSGISRYEVEYSADGINFTPIDQVAANTQKQATYKITVPAPVGGTGFYRLKIIDNDGKATFSNTENVLIAKPSAIILYPNPARNEIHISVQESMLNKPAIIRVFSGSGILVYEEKKHAVSKTEVLQLGRLAPGKYNVQFITGNEATSKSIVIVK